MPRRGDADREQPMRLRLLRRRFRRIQDGLQHGLPAQARLETDLLLCQHLPGEVGQDRADPQRLEINAQEATVIRIEPHRDRRATPPRGTGVILRQDAPLKEFVHIVADRGRIDVELAGQVKARTTPFAENGIEDPVLVRDQFRFPRPMTLNHTHAEPSRGKGMRTVPASGLLVPGTSPTARRSVARGDPASNRGDGEGEALPAGRSSINRSRRR